MNKTVILLLIALLFSVNLIAGGKGINKSKDSTSIAIVTGVDKTVSVKLANPYSGTATYTVGSFVGSINSETAKFYCIDLAHNLVYNQEYTDAGETSSEVTYILNNFYPFVSYPYSGSLSSINKEAAAIQIAIWHFVDGLDISKVENTEIKNRAKEISELTKRNAGLVRPVKTLVITPLQEKFRPGEKGRFIVEAYDILNRPAKNVSIDLTSSSGTLSKTKIVTDSTGVSEVVTLDNISSVENVIITARGMLVIPHGTRYVHKVKGDTYQKLVLATPKTDLKEVKTTLSWFSEIDLEISKSVDPDSIGDNQSVTFTILLKNNGNAAATNISVYEKLPQGLNFVSYNATHGSYDINTCLWTIDALQAQGTATLSITVMTDYPDFFKSSFNLGIASDYNLFIFDDLYQPSSDTEGKVAVGRDANLANYSIGEMLPFIPGQNVFIVGRKATFKSGAVLNGNMVYGKFLDITEQFGVIGGEIIEDSLIDFKAAESYFRDLSLKLSAYTSNGTDGFEYGTVSLKGTSPYLNVFNIDGSKITSANDVRITAPNGSVVLVNIAGSKISWTGGLHISGTDKSNVLFNFFEADSIYIEKISITGSVLAPLAHIDFVTGVQYGQMIAKSLSGRAQFNLAPFAGYVPPQPYITNYVNIVALDQPETDLSNNSAFAVLKLDYNPLIEQSPEVPEIKWKEENNILEGHLIWTNDYSNGRVLAGTWGGKVLLKQDSSWITVNEGMNSAYLWSIKTIGSKVIVSSEKGIYLTDETFTNWEFVSPDSLDVRALEVFGDYLYAGSWGYGLYRSRLDDLHTWESVNTGIANLAIHSMTSDGTRLYLASFDNGILSSADGVTFDLENIGYPHIWSIKAVNGKLFAGTYGDGLYMFNASNSEWIKVNEGIYADHVYSLVTDEAGNLFINTWMQGIYMIPAGTEVALSLGLAGIETGSIVYDNTTGTIIVSASNGKIYSAVVSEVVSAEMNSGTVMEYSLSQNYPNPFNPSTVIKYQIAKEGFVSLKVYDILGRETAVLVNSAQKSGKYEVRFNASNLSTGVYFYRLESEGYSSVKKLMLVK